MSTMPASALGPNTETLGEIYFLHNRIYLTSDENGIIPTFAPSSRPAKFWQGASLPFRVIESIFLLHHDLNLLDFYEVTALLHDVQLVLDDAKQNEDLLNAEDVAELEQWCHALSRDILQIFDDHVRAICFMRPEQPDDKDNVQTWYETIDNFLTLSRNFAVDNEKARSWTLARSHVDKIYKDTFGRSYPPKLDPSEVAESRGPFRNYGNFLPDLSILALDDPKRTDGVWINATLDQFVDYVRILCQSEVMDNDIHEVYEFLGKMQKFVRFMGDVVPGTNQCTSGLFISTRAGIIYDGWCNRLVYKFDLVLQQDLATRYSIIQEQIQNSTDLHIIEFAIARLCADLRAAYSPAPHSFAMTDDVWGRMVPRMLSEDAYDAFMMNLQDLANTLTDKVAASSEKKYLWSLLAKCLTKTYMMWSDSSVQRDDDGYHLERDLLVSSMIRQQLAAVVYEPAIVNATILENVVAEYCIAVAQARTLRGSVYSHIRKFSEKPLGDLEKGLLHAYLQNNQWDTNAMRAMQKAAVRLNFLTDGPVYIRRAHQGCKSWEEQPVNLNAASIQTFDPTPPVIFEQPLSLSSSSSGLSQPAQRPVSYFSRTLTVSAETTTQAQTVTDTATVQDHDAVTGDIDAHTLPQSSPKTTSPTSDFVAWGGAFASTKTSSSKANNSTTTPAHTQFSDPESFDLLSSFDYPTNPYPETRAVERAKSREIQRDLSNPDIISSGACPDDVVNVPPRHTSPPKSSSAKNHYIPYGPWDLIKAIWNRRQKKRAARRAKPRAQVTPRDLRNTSGPKRPGILSPVTRSPNRVRKSVTIDSDLPRAPRLRGGGSRRDVGKLLKQLRDRTVGFWFPRDQPSPTEMQVRFLAPANFDVDVAVRRASVHALSVAPQDNLTDDQIRVLSANMSAAPATASSFSIFQDSSTRSNSPAPTNTPADPSANRPPAGNQEHEAQLRDDRLRRMQGLPPRMAGDNPSDQENRLPLASINASSPSQQSPIMGSTDPACNATDCHPCPKYRGEYHHDCPLVARVHSPSPIESTPRPNSPASSYNNNDNNNGPNGGLPIPVTDTNGMNGKHTTSSSSKSSLPPRSRTEIPSSQSPPPAASPIPIPTIPSPIPISVPVTRDVKPQPTITTSPKSNSNSNSSSSTSSSRRRRRRQRTQRTPTSAAAYIPSPTRPRTRAQVRAQIIESQGSASVSQVMAGDVMQTPLTATSVVSTTGRGRGSGRGRGRGQGRSRRGGRANGKGSVGGDTAGQTSAATGSP